MKWMLCASSPSPPPCSLCLSVYTISLEYHSFTWLKRNKFYIPPLKSGIFCTLQAGIVIHQTPAAIALESKCQEINSNPDISTDEINKGVILRKQNARPLSLLYSETLQEEEEEEAILTDSEKRELHLDDVGTVASRTPRFPGRVGSSPKVEKVRELDEEALKEALRIRRVRTIELLKEAMTASNLSQKYSDNLISHLDGFVDYIIIKAASTKSNTDFANANFTTRARFCIKNSGVVELVKWLKHNQMSFPRIGELVSAAADDLEGLRLRVRWLKSIHVKGRYLGVVLTKNERIIRRPIEDLDCNVQLLENSGVAMDWMGFIISHCPEILSFDIEELKCRVNFFLELGMSDKDFGTMLFEYPKVIGFFTLEDMNNKAKYLQEFGLSNTDLGRLIAIRPRLLACNIEEGWKPLVKYLYYLGIQRSGMRRLLIKEPSIFCLNLTENIAPKVRFLRAIGVNDEAIGEVLVKFPKLLTYSLYKKTRPVVKFLIEVAGVPEADIGKVIASEPELIGCSLSGKLEVVAKFFFAIGIPPQILGRMIADFPMLLKYNLSVIRPKYLYLKRVMVRPLKDLIGFPRFFSYSLSSRIIPRHEILVENGISFSLRYMLAPTDEEFTRRVQAALGSTESCEVGDPDKSGMPVDEFLKERNNFVSLEESRG
ncbi:transcription termination factor MTERF2, chloroplastic isoform X1 [Cryptomeria japonica]|uniref:transcription termination factor MTERF2, chloroplastic isoform X1 n=1 Tax=Cryptomeria japonica TaxID=3369 RepID=UPI0025AD85D2|nr:transcription termination factor MTERF2, chloroplastic isoform X1 [Cryptomeria japonica]